MDSPPVGSGGTAQVVQASGIYSQVHTVARRDALTAFILAPMRRIRPGDLVAVRNGNADTVFAVLTKQILFGGHWCYAFHHAVSVGDAEAMTGRPGFNCFVDFIVPKREERIVTLARRNDFAALMGPEELHQEPPVGDPNWSVWRWAEGKRERAELVRYTRCLSPEERNTPRYSCMPADMVCDLAGRQWQPHMSLPRDLG